MKSSFTGEGIGKPGLTSNVTIRNRVWDWEVEGSGEAQVTRVWRKGRRMADVRLRIDKTEMFTQNGISAAPEIPSRSKTAEIGRCGMIRLL
jgi:hypothetical protein